MKPADFEQQLNKLCAEAERSGILVFIIVKMLMQKMREEYEKIPLDNIEDLGLE